MRIYETLAGAFFLAVTANAIAGADGPARAMQVRRSVLLASAVPTAPAVELKPPAGIYAGFVDAGVAKATSPLVQTFLKGILSGVHIAFGAYLVLSVGANLPGLAQTNPGLQKIISGAFGLPLGLMMVLVTGGELTLTHSGWEYSAATNSAFSLLLLTCWTTAPATSSNLRHSGKPSRAARCSAVDRPKTV